ncbi:uncharacterized protein [Asterias amurensis]|uniref:uncharacterized protein isoform X4 n=1 Tax=Asterias amurensis TaxID=7602 RepID=UPI003AB46D2F
MTTALVPLARPPSEQLVDLHVYLVPTEVWNEKYHSAYNDVISQTISAGFVRVWPELSLYYLRNQIIDQLGYDVLPPEYVFLKSVGRCLTQVKTKQEFELKVKNFIPPQVTLPELFVLEAKRDDLSLASFESQFEPDSHRSNHDRMDIIAEEHICEEGIEIQPSKHRQASGISGQQKKLSKIPRKKGSNIGTKASIQSGNQTGKLIERQASQQQTRRQKGAATVKQVGKQPLAKALGNRTLAKKAVGLRTGTQNEVVGKQPLARKVAGAKPPLNSTTVTTAQNGKDQAREITNKVVIGGRSMQKRDQTGKQVGIRTEERPVLANQAKGVAQGVVQGVAGSDEGSYDTGSSNPTWNSRRERTGQECTAPKPCRNSNGGVPPLPLQHLEPRKGVDPASPLKSWRPDTYTNNTNEDSGIAELEYGRQGSNSLDGNDKDGRPQGQGTFLINSRQGPEGGRAQQSRHDKKRHQHLEDGTPLPPNTAAQDQERQRQAEAREKQQQDRERKIKEDAAREQEHKERQLEKENQRLIEKRKKEKEDEEERQRLFKARQHEIEKRRQEQAEAKRLKEEDEEREMEEEIRKRQADELKQSRQKSHQDARRKEREQFTPHSQRDGGSRQQKEEQFGGNTRQSNRTHDEGVSLADETGGSPGNDGSFGSAGASSDGVQDPSGVSRAIFDSEGERILAQVQEMQDRRYLLESEREELMRFAKTLQSRMIDRRNKDEDGGESGGGTMRPVRDLWKKRYFEEKKKTNPLEEQVNRLRGQLDQQHRKLLSHLEGRGAYQKGAPRINAPPSKKNDHKILIIKTKHSIEDLRRRVENSKMKLTSEIKLRNQAETELRNLRSEVIQRKINVTISTSKSKLQNTIGRDEAQPSRNMATRGTGVSVTPHGSQKRGVKF